MRRKGKETLARGVKDIELLKSHHYRPFDKADKTHKECLSPRLPLPLLVGILMSVRPTCLPLALLLLIFLPPPFSSSHSTIPPPSLLFIPASPRRCHKLCECNVRAAAPMLRERSSRSSPGVVPVVQDRENRRRTGLGREIRAGLERRMS